MAYSRSKKTADSAAMYAIALIRHDEAKEIYRGAFEQAISFMSGFLRTPLPSGVSLVVTCGDSKMTGSSLANGTFPARPTRKTARKPR